MPITVCSTGILTSAARPTNVYKMHWEQHLWVWTNLYTIWHTVGLYWVPGHAGVRGNEIADRLTRDGSVQRFVKPEPVLGVSRQNIRRKTKHWMDKQHLALWRGPCSTQRQAQKLISGPDPATGARLLSFNRTQSRAVIGLLTGHNSFRRHLHIMGLCNDPICRKCGTKEETSVHILRVWGVSLTQACISGFLLFWTKGSRHGGHLELC
jgi:hypothetical protein